MSREGPPRSHLRMTRHSGNSVPLWFDHGPTRSMTRRPMLNGISFHSSKGGIERTLLQISRTLFCLEVRFVLFRQEPRSVLGVKDSLKIVRCHRVTPSSV